MSEPTGLILIVPAVTDILPRLTAALAHTAVASVIITPPSWRLPADNPDQDADRHDALSTTRALDRTIAGELVSLIQSHDVAAVIANDPETADACGADGIHLDPSPMIEELYKATRSFLGPNAIVGVTPAPTRHSAMLLAEAGADYVAFAVAVDSANAGIERIAWWAEIFETPCIALTSGDIAIIEAATAAGADFIAIPLDPARPQDALLGDLTEAAERIAAISAQRLEDAKSP